MKVFVHGVPDTPHLWTPLIEALGLGHKDHVAPALPGFGVPFPDGFSPDKDAYAAWLVGELEALAAGHGPVELVGHDWGAILSLRVASLRPELVRSWAISGALLDAKYDGHRIAKIWNTPLVGELFMALAAPSVMVRTSGLLGMPKPIARVERPYWDSRMKSAILGLYRSADALRIRGPWIDGLARLPTRGAVIWGRKDPYIPLATAERFAAERGARMATLDAGHWVVSEKPQAFAKELERFWAD